MSTPSRIILKIRKRDIGREIMFDPTKLPTELKEWVERDAKSGRIWLDQRGKEKSKPITIKGEYIGIYCHWDGDYVGEVLKKYFKNYETALNLIAGGFCSAIYHAHVTHYANRKGVKWNNIKPIQGSLDDIRDRIYGIYEYVFKNGQWSSKKC